GQWITGDINNTARSIMFVQLSQSLDDCTGTLAGWVQQYGVKPALLLHPTGVHTKKIGANKPNSFLQAVLLSGTLCSLKQRLATFNTNDLSCVGRKRQCEVSQAAK